MAWMGTVTFDVNRRYNYFDINRENTNIAYLRDLLKSLGYTVNLTKPIKTDYGLMDFPTVSAINNVRKNILDLISSVPEAVKALQATGSLVGTFRAGELSMIYQNAVVPNIFVINDRIQRFDYNEANKLELNLQFLYDLMSDKKYKLRWAGTFKSGEEGLIY